MPPHATVIFPGPAIVGKAAGCTKIVLDTDANCLLQASVAVHVSVTKSPQAPGVDVNVDVAEVPVIEQPPLNPLVKLNVEAAGIPPHATVIFPGAVIVGNVAGSTIIVLDTDASGLLQASVAVHVSVTRPPHAPGVAVNVEVTEVPVIAQPPLNPLV